MRMKKLLQNRVKFLLLILSFVCLPLIFAPANTIKGGKKNSRIACKHKKTIYTYPTIKVTNNRHGYNKNLKRPKKRNFSFPV